MKTSALILLSALSMTSFQASAQAAKDMPVRKPMPFVVKNFQAARDLELERVKVSRANGLTYQSCLEAAKSGPDVVVCQAAHQEAMTAYLSKQVASGRLQAAVGVPQPSPIAPAK